MKKLLVALSLSTAIVGLSACSSGSDKEAVVESKAGNITKDEFYESLKKHQGEDVLKQLITIKVLESNYKVSDKEVDADLKKIKDQLGDNFKAALEQQGVTEKDLKDDLRLNLLQEKALTEDIKVSDKDIKERYDRMKVEIKAQHILVDDKKTADEVKKKLDEGGDFAKLVKEYSKDTGSAENDGVIDYFTTGAMDKAFEDKAYSMKKDEISGPVQSQFGFHIIKVLDKRDVKDVPKFDEVKDQIRREIAMNRIDQVEAQEKINKIIKDAKVKIKVKGMEDILKDEPIDIQG